MKRTITLMLAACCLLLTACDNSSIGIIGGSDGPTQVYINKSNENSLTTVYKAISRLSKIEWFRNSVRDIRAFKVEDWSDFTEIVKNGR